MHLTASDLYPYFRPSECRLRVYLKAKHEAEDEPSPYEAVILRLGERHEAAHLASLGGAAKRGFAETWGALLVPSTATSLQRVRSC